MNFSDKNMHSAVNAVLNNFRYNYAHAKLKTLSFDESDTKYYEPYDGKGKVICLQGVYVTDSKFPNFNDLQPNSTLHWSWTIIKAENGDWNVKDSGPFGI